jgi:beta-glucosidase
MVHFSPDGQFPEATRVAGGIVCLHEQPYAEGVGDQADLTLSGAERQLLQRVRARCDRLVVVLYSGRPLIITDELPLADAWVAAWLPGTEGQGIADVLFGDYPFHGRLPLTWPRSPAQIPFDGAPTARQAPANPLFPFGFGLLT